MLLGIVVFWILCKLSAPVYCYVLLTAWLMIRLGEAVNEK